MLPFYFLPLAVDVGTPVVQQVHQISSSDGFWPVVTMLLYILLTITQTWYQEWKNRIAAGHVAAKVEEARRAAKITSNKVDDVADKVDRSNEVAQKLTEGVEKVEKIVNGSGLTAAVFRIEQNQAESKAKFVQLSDEVKKNTISISLINQKMATSK